MSKETPLPDDLNEIVQYRALSKLGPAVIASAARNREDGNWFCLGSVSLVGVIGSKTATQAGFATFSNAKEAIKWLRETAAKFIREDVAFPGEPTDVVVLAITRQEKRKEQDELKRGVATPTDLDWRLYRSWKNGEIRDCGAA